MNDKIFPLDALDCIVIGSCFSLAVLWVFLLDQVLL